MNNTERCGNPVGRGGTRWRCGWNGRLPLFIRLRSEDKLVCPCEASEHHTLTTDQAGVRGRSRLGPSPSPHSCKRFLCFGASTHFHISLDSSQKQEPFRHKSETFPGLRTFAADRVWFHDLPHFQVIDKMGKNMAKAKEYQLCMTVFPSQELASINTARSEWGGKGRFGVSSWNPKIRDQGENSESCS